MRRLLEDIGQQRGLWSAKIGLKHFTNPENQNPDVFYVCKIKRLIHESKVDKNNVLQLLVQEAIARIEAPDAL